MLQVQCFSCRFARDVRVSYCKQLAGPGYALLPRYRTPATRSALPEPSCSSRTQEADPDLKTQLETNMGATGKIPLLSRQLWAGHGKCAVEAIPNSKSNAPDIMVLLEKAIPNPKSGTFNEMYVSVVASRF